ncbi:MAG: DNA-processing protein DprA [Crocinitomicaceae bacterium]|jgi:DNA processing protein
MLHRTGPIRAKELMLSLDSLEELFLLSDKDLATKTDLTITQVKSLKRKEALEKAQKPHDYFVKNQINCTFYTDDNYPERLRNCIDSPLIYYSKGAIELNTEKVVAIVGTRDCTEYGDQIVRSLIQSFQGQQITVISGLALGIDTLVHRYCIEYGIPTIGVLGHGIDRVYPSRNKALAERMQANGGIMTEFIPGTIPDRENFPKRNRIVAGLADATIVIESKLKGGSLITANLANDYNRDVFAFPGSIHKEASQGCNKLIYDQKAHLMQDPSDFLNLMNWHPSEIKEENQQSIFKTLSENQKAIVSSLLKHRLIQIDKISMETALPISELNTELFGLEMDGLIKSHPGNRYSMI